MDCMRPVTLALAFLFAITQATLAQDPSMFDVGLDNQMGLIFSPDGESAFWVAWNGRWGSESAGKRTIYMSQPPETFITAIVRRRDGSQPYRSKG